MFVLYCKIERIQSTGDGQEKTPASLSLNLSQSTSISGLAQNEQGGWPLRVTMADRGDIGRPTSYNTTQTPLYTN